MRIKQIRSILSLSLMLAILAACSSPTSPPPTIERTAIPGPTTTEPPVTVEGTDPTAMQAGACENQYYPVREGATWSYASVGSTVGNYSFTDTITSVRADGFTLSTQSGGVTRTQEWACRPEGLLALQLGGAPAAMLNAQQMQLELQLQNATGITFPSRINAGDQWQHTLSVTGNMEFMGQQGTTEGDAQNNFTAMGTESVTVPAGTFDAMKIQVETRIRFDVNYQGLSVPVAFSATYDYWFAEGIGWVRASGTGEMAGVSLTDTLELQSYSIL
jgi:hypothetical protein